MKYVGIDLHKKTISACVVIKERGKRKVAARKRLECQDEAEIAAWFGELGKFEVVVEATASYEWFVKLVEPLAHRVLLAHPKKLRVIAESGRATSSTPRCWRSSWPATRSRWPIVLGRGSANIAR